MDLSLDDLLEEVEGALSEPSKASSLPYKSTPLPPNGISKNQQPPPAYGGDPLSRPKCMTPSSMGSSSPLVAASVLGTSRSVPSLQPAASDPNSPRNLVPHPPVERRPSNQTVYNPKQKFVHAAPSGSSSGVDINRTAPSSPSPLAREVLAPATLSMPMPSSSLSRGIPVVERSYASSSSPKAPVSPSSSQQPRSPQPLCAEASSYFPPTARPISPLPSPTDSEIERFTDSLLSSGLPSPSRGSSKPATPVSVPPHPTSITTSFPGVSNSGPGTSSGLLNASMSPLFSSNRKKCAAIFLGGAEARTGCCTSSAVKCACDNMRCTACDFAVMRFPKRRWGGEVDYMFLRNNMPDAQKLSVKLLDAPGMSAYSCQCSWRSIEDFVRVMPSGELRWVCGGHQG